MLLEFKSISIVKSISLLILNSFVLSIYIDIFLDYCSSCNSISDLHTDKFVRLFYLFLFLECFNEFKFILSFNYDSLPLVHNYS